MTIAESRRFEDLLETGQSDSNYDFEQIFARESFSARRRSRKKYKILKGLDRLLQGMLFDAERVYYLTWGVEGSLVDRYFLGWVMYYINRTAILLTTHRVLMVRINSSGRPRDVIRQIRYEAIELIRPSWTGHTVVRTRDRRKRVFASVPGPDRKYLRERLREMQESWAMAESLVTSSEDLCPHCYQPVDGRPSECPYCSGGFKAVRSAVTRSLIFPGLGDWYLGHRTFAAFEILFSGMIWLGYWLPPVDEFGNDLPYTPLSDLLIGAATIWVLMHGIDAAATLRIAMAGIYPATAPAIGDATASPARVQSAPADIAQP